MTSHDMDMSEMHHLLRICERSCNLAPLVGGVNEKSEV